jgi:hypothetical protein
MSWYWTKWWRFAVSVSMHDRHALIIDQAGQWRPLVGPIWILTRRERTVIHP